MGFVNDEEVYSSTVREAEDKKYLAAKQANFNDSSRG